MQKPVFLTYYYLKCLLARFSHQCRYKVPHLPGRSWLATIAELMGLVRLFSFPWAGSIAQPATIPAPTAQSSPWASRTYPQDTLQWAPWLYSFHALQSAVHKSLFHSFAIAPCVHYHDVLDVRGPICLTCDVNFCLSVLTFTPCPSPFISLLFFFPSIFHRSLLSLHSPICSPLLFLSKSPNILWAQCAIHCQHISHRSGVAQHSNII